MNLLKGKCFGTWPILEPRESKFKRDHDLEFYKLEILKFFLVEIENLLKNSYRYELDVRSSGGLS